MPLKKMLQFPQTQRCSEPRDRILGITGILEVVVGDRDLPWLEEGLSVEQVYLEAFYFFVQSDPSLSNFRMAAFDTSCPLSLPSWCPNFHRKRTSLESTDGFSDMLQGLYSKPWQASTFQQIINRSSDPKVLSVQGVRVDNVVVCLPEWRRLDLKHYTQLQDTVYRIVQYAAT